MADNMADNRKYFTLLTDKGRFKIASAAANKETVKITHFAIGDGNGQETNPVPSQTELVNEVWRTQVEAVEIDSENPAAVLIAAIIPHDVGGWWMREFGIFDVDNDMLAVVKPVPAYKAVSGDGQVEDIYYQFQLVIGEQAEVVVIVDTSVMWATREYVETRRIPMWQMANTPWLPVIATDVQTPPASPRLGDTYLVPTGAKGDWKDKACKLAEWTAKKWTFMQTPKGHGISLPDGRILQKSADQYQPKIAMDVQSGKWFYGIASGSAAVMAVNLNPPVMQLVDGLTIKMKAVIANAEGATINLNGLGPKRIFAAARAGLTPLKGGEMQHGRIYSLTFNTFLDVNGGWFLDSSAQDSGLQPGALMFFAMPNEPEGWLECDGRTLSRDEFSPLFRAIGTHWGEGDGKTTFNIPDFRGGFLRGWNSDPTNGLDAGRVFASRQDDEIKEHKHDGKTKRAGKHKHGVYASSWRQAIHGDNLGGSAGVGGTPNNIDTSEVDDHFHDLEINNTGGSETRPVNWAVLHCIKI